MLARSYTFTHAITRKPSLNCINGLRAVDVGTPDFERFCAAHDDYIKTLRSTGATVVELETLDAFPDCVFVEDASLCLPQGAIVLRPGAPTRLGEAKAMQPALEKLYSKVLNIEDVDQNSFIEGGDILVTEKEILIGQSARTNSAGIEALRTLTAPWGYKVREVQTPPDVLHFKTDCSVLDETTILATKRLAATGCFEGYTVIETAEGEEAAANSIRFNELVLFPKGFVKTMEKLQTAGFNVKEIDNSQAAKLDGGMSCLSLRFTPS